MQYLNQTLGKIYLCFYVPYNLLPAPPRKKKIYFFLTRNFQSSLQITLLNISLMRIRCKLHALIEFLINTVILFVMVGINFFT